MIPNAKPMLSPCEGCNRTNVPRYLYESWHVETHWDGPLTVLCEACMRSFSRETKVRLFEPTGARGRA